MTVSWYERTMAETRANAKSLIVYWEPAEDSRLIALIASGWHYKDIALDLRRTYAAVQTRVMTLRKAGRL